MVAGRLNIERYFCRYPIVQTHQEVVFDRELLTKWAPITSPEPIYLRILPALVIADSEWSISEY